MKGMNDGLVKCGGKAFFFFFSFLFSFLSFLLLLLMMEFGRQKGGLAGSYLDNRTDL